jgi:proline dehydrogenase
MNGRVMASPPPPFSAAYAPDDSAIAERLLASARLDHEQEQRIGRVATRLIEAIRTNDDPLGGVEDMLREFALSTKEGLALMVLAEALLRVPDARTADQFIEDKLGEGDFIHHETKSSAFLVNASAWALGMSARVIQAGETPQGTIGRLAKRLGAPAVRAATRQAMRLMGSHFVLGETIEAALARVHAPTAARYSFDMLGEGARTAEDAQRYFNAYATAVEAIGRSAGGRPLPERPGISVKLSALHPRFEAVSHARVMAELVPRLIELARRAKSHELNFTVDAEEAARLELSLDVISAVFSDPSLKGWDGFGLAIQAYQKRAAEVIAYVDALARAHARRMMVRLVKGAYWDTEVKRAQERGLDGYPVFTRKAMTDLNYVDCARHLLALRPRIFPQFATHNALTVATVLELAGGESGFEFQRRHGRGALCAPERRLSEARLSHLRAGRQSPRPAGLSGAASAGERRQLVLCRARGRRCGPGRDAVAAAGRHHRRRGAGAPSRNSAAARPAAASGQLARRRIWRARRLVPTRRRHRASKDPCEGQHRRCVSHRCRTRSCHGPRRFPRLERNACRPPRGDAGEGGRPARNPSLTFHGAVATRGRQDTRRRAL